MTDCPDRRALAAFYGQVPGMIVIEATGGWVVTGLEPGLRQLAFSGSPNGFRHLA